MRMLHHLQCSQTPAAASSSEVKRQHKPDWPYCAPAPRKIGCVTPKNHIEPRWSDKITTSGEKGCLKTLLGWAGKCLDAVNQIFFFFFSLSHVDASVPLCRSPACFALWLTGVLVAHKAPRTLHIFSNLHCCCTCLKKQQQNSTLTKKIYLNWSVSLVILWVM